MGRVSKKARKHAFESYAANLSHYHPGVLRKFLCPICCTLYEQNALDGPNPQVTVAHIVPRALGGRVWTLACKRCNSNLGSRYDAQLVREHRFRDWEHGNGAWPARLKSGSAEVRAELRRPAGGWDFQLVASQINPADERAFRKQLESGRPLEFAVTVRLWNRKSRNRALFHSAFLMMFRTFGYEYVLSPEVEPILRLLHGQPDSDDLRSALITVHPNASDGGVELPTALLLAKPEEFRCFAAMLPDPKSQGAARMVAMPGFGQQGKDCFRRILASDGKWGRIGGKAIECPTLEGLSDAKFKGRAHYLWERA